MSLGQAPQSEDVFRSGSQFCRDRLAPTSIYELLYRESHRLFPDADFADLYAKIGRDSVPPRIVAVVMVLQRVEGLSGATAALAARLRAVCRRDDDYRAPGNPVCDWQDEAAREALIDALSRDAYAILPLLDGQRLSTEVSEAVQLLSTVVGQDIELC